MSALIASAQESFAARHHFWIRRLHSLSGIIPLGAFLFLTVVLAPVLTLAIVGGYGFAVWMLQIIAGPPGVS